MAEDHFKRHNHYDGVVDWNFNIVYDSQPAIARMANAYKHILERPELYKPIPTEWLHATVLRVGIENEYSEAEMLKVADMVQLRLKELILPEFHFSNYLLIHGNICFKVEPESELQRIYAIVTESLESIVGPSRATKSPYGHFIAHTSFAYTKQHDNEAEILRLLDSANIEPAIFHIKHIPLIKQKPINGHYEWKVIKDIVVG